LKETGAKRLAENTELYLLEIETAKKLGRNPMVELPVDIYTEEMKSGQKIIITIDVVDDVEITIKNSQVIIKKK